MHVIITGATGAVGSEVLLQGLRHPAITRVTLLQRRHLQIIDSSTSDLLSSLPNSSKLTTIIHSDFLSYPPSLLAQLEGADGVLWCQGITGPFPKVSKRGYEVVMKEYPVAAAKAFSQLKKEGERKFVFAYLSAAAADQSGKSWFWVGNAKGDVEASLAALRSTLPTLATFFFRPAPVKPTTPPSSASFFQKIIKKKLYYTLMDFMVIRGDVIAQAMIESVLKGGTGEIEGWPGKGLEGNENTFSISEMKALAARSELAGTNGS